MFRNKSKIFLFFVCLLFCSGLGLVSTSTQHPFSNYYPIVKIECDLDLSDTPEAKGSDSVGSGVIISKKINSTVQLNTSHTYSYDVLTCAHVILADRIKTITSVDPTRTYRLTVSCLDLDTPMQYKSTILQKEYNATILRHDSAKDLGLIRFESDIDYGVARVAREEPNLLDLVTSVGYPLGLNLIVTHGQVLPRYENENMYKQMCSAPIAPGNSGGAVLSAEGELLGISCAVASYGNAFIQLTVPHLHIFIPIQPAMSWVNQTE